MPPKKYYWIYWTNTGDTTVHAKSYANQNEQMRDYNMAKTYANVNWIGRSTCKVSKQQIVNAIRPAPILEK